MKEVKKYPADSDQIVEVPMTRAQKLARQEVLSSFYPLDEELPKALPSQETSIDWAIIFKKCVQK